MKKSVLIALCFVAGLIAVGCRADVVLQDDSCAELPSDPEELFNYAVENDLFIDVDAEAVANEHLSSIAGNHSPSEEFIRKNILCRVAYERFSKHVTLEDGIEYVGIKSGAEIKISEQLFQWFMRELEEGNEHVMKAKERGERVFVIDRRAGAGTLCVAQGEDGKLEIVDAPLENGNDVYVTQDMVEAKGIE